MIEVRTEVWTCDRCGARTRAHARHECPKPGIGSFDLGEPTSVARFEDIADALDEAILEHEREPGTDVWASFWDRLTDGTFIPDRPL